MDQTGVMDLCGVCVGVEHRSIHRWHTQDVVMFPDVGIVMWALLDELQHFNYVRWARWVNLEEGSWITSNEHANYRLSPSPGS